MLVCVGQASIGEEEIIIREKALTADSAAVYDEAALLASYAGSVTQAQETEP